MGFKTFLGTTKGKIITIASGATVVAAGIAVAVALQGQGYRSIVVEQAQGEVSITGEKNNGQAYQGEKLYDGDNVDVGVASEMVMCMDLDKYVYADEGTNFSIVASSAKDDSHLKLELNKGSELNKLESKLGPNDSYEVDTPNSTMSVRGTVFRVTVYEKDGIYYTLLEVEEGEVLVRLKTSDGTYNGVEASFTAGQSALIRGNSDYSEFVVGEESEIVLLLNYEMLPEQATPRLIELLEYVDEEAGMIVGDVEAQHIEDVENNEENDDSDEGDSNEDSAVIEEETESVETENEETIVDEEAEQTGGNTSRTANGNNNTVQTHTHTAGDWIVTTEATCSAVGMRQRVCTVCGTAMESEEIPVSGHVASDWVIIGYPDCNTMGGKVQSCIYCGKQMAVQDIPRTGHDYSNGQCTECGGTDPAVIEARTAAAQQVDRHEPEGAGTPDPDPGPQADPTRCAHNGSYHTLPGNDGAPIKVCDLCGKIIE